MIFITGESSKTRADFKRLNVSDDSASGSAPDQASDSLSDSDVEVEATKKKQKKQKKKFAPSKKVAKTKVEAIRVRGKQQPYKNSQYISSQCPALRVCRLTIFGEFVAIEHPLGFH